jgi:hypothetical protein
MKVGVEGISHGNMIGAGIRKKVNKIWSRDTVKMIADKIPGSKIFDGHDARNNDARPDVGRTVHGFTTADSGKVEAQAIGYIKDESARDRIRSGKLDICSIEGDLKLATDGASDSFVVKAVDKITGLALGDSTIESPGFGGASIVTAVQMMAGDGEKKEDPMPVTKADVKKFIDDAGLNPSDLFGGEKLSQDKTVLGLLKAAMDEESSGKEKEELEKSNKEKDERIKELEKENLKSKIKDDAGPKIKDILKGRNLSEAQAATLEKNTLEKLSTDEALDAEKLDEAIKSAIEEGIQFLKDAGALAEEKKGDGDGDDKSDKTDGDKTPPPPGSDPGKEKENKLIPKRDY